jgi:hypothetical protein
MAAETITIGRIAYTIDRSIAEDRCATRLMGSLTGPRGAFGYIVQAKDSGAVVVMGIKALERMHPSEVKAALAGAFSFEPAQSVTDRAEPVDGLTVHRDSRVSRHGRMLGWAYRHPQRLGTSQPWTYAMDLDGHGSDGRTSHIGYGTQRAAAEALARRWAA